MSHEDVARKETIRQRIWTQLEESGASPRGAHGRIPDFVGSDHAADLLTTLTEWQQAATVKANPDHAQQPVRARALRHGKLLFMAVPKLANIKPFYRLDPRELGEHPERSADRHIAAESAPTVAVQELPPIDFIVCGSVAVNHEGVRIGKGAGYSDIEIALLAEAGLLSDRTVIVTTVHTLQVVEEPLPRVDHDFSVDMIITPDEVIRCSPSCRPRGLEWKHLSPEKIATIPVLAARTGVSTS
ncbi:MAG TPA: 5-formyltetrahydrofolate cyclo-ligase [Pseudonocardiaceae bacterium]|jgi:5-formyltetrahydrofolate cyclo-ligase